MKNTSKRDRSNVQKALAKARRNHMGPMSLTQQTEKDEKKEQSKRACRKPVDY